MDKESSQVINNSLLYDIPKKQTVVRFHLIKYVKQKVIILKK